MKTNHTRNQAHQELREAKIRGFWEFHPSCSSTFSTDTKWVKKASEKSLSSAQPQCRKLFLAQQKKKRKVSKTMWTIYIIPLKQLFKGRCVGMPQLFILKLYLTTVVKGMSEALWAWTCWPLSSSPALVLQGASEHFLLVSCVSFSQQ